MASMALASNFSPLAFAKDKKESDLKKREKNKRAKEMVVTIFGNLHFGAYFTILHIGFLTNLAMCANDAAIQCHLVFNDDVLYHTHILSAYSNK